ncbi:MAG: glutamate synthase-related protein, partial [Gemmatimonadaceae bacterium]
GGTGASPRGSIKNAGTPWELGLSEAHQALVRGGLRGRVRLQVDGGLKTGRDVVLAALLGAEEFGFGTATLVAAGCVMARQCHLNSCPAGIATQREELRKKFAGTPDEVVRFFIAVADEVREILALIGARRLDDIIGRTELAERRAPSHGKAASVRLDRLLAPRQGNGARRSGQARNDPPVTGTGIDERVLRELRFLHGELRPVDLLVPITNADRAVGARIAGQIVEMTHAHAVAARTVQLHLRGSAGQSFGAFCVDGMRLVLDGEANDYVGKGMSGGEIVIRPAAGARHDGRQVIAGNTLLYGATGGMAFIGGRVGERFGVRNSGALAVVEGTGDHAGEYMTAGGIVILGSAGRNVGAGMTGGVLFCLDGDGSLAQRTHREWVDGGTALAPAEEYWVRDLLVRHAQATYSRVAEHLLNNWEQTRHLVRRVSPVGTDATRPLPLLPQEVARIELRPHAPAATPMRAVSGSASRSAPPAPASAAPPP